MRIKQTANKITIIDEPVTIDEDGRGQTEDGTVITQVGITITSSSKKDGMTHEAPTARKD